ncbi:hypothetical protein ACN47E_002345 [Coniothyrium glycines]
MRFALSVAALAGAAIAAPHAGRPNNNNGYVVVEVATVVETVYVTEGYPAVKPTPQPSSSPPYQAPVVTPSVKYEAAAPSSQKYEAPAQPTYEPYKPAPEPTPSAPAPASNGYMAVVDEWRGKLGMKALICDSKLESNALDTVQSSNGQMVHKLNSGSFAQVLAPGDDDFEHVFVGGWLCEIPTLPGLEGVCETASQGWTYQGQTGHAEILTSDSYSKIGCALYAGIWSCDLA